VVCWTIECGTTEARRRSFSDSLIYRLIANEIWHPTDVQCGFQPVSIGCTEIDAYRQAFKLNNRRLAEFIHGR
jgi:hypothetical protein